MNSGRVQMLLYHRQKYACYICDCCLYDVRNAPLYAPPLKAACMLEAQTCCCPLGIIVSDMFFHPIFAVNMVLPYIGVAGTLGVFVGAQLVWGNYKKQKSITTTIKVFYGFRLTLVQSFL